MNPPACKRFFVTVTNGIKHNAEGSLYRIIMDRPEKRNSFTVEMYNKLGRALKEANNNKATRLTVLTGSGRIFTSGNDLSNVSKAHNHAEVVEFTNCVLSEMQETINSFIEHEKPLIALVNGPSFGFGTVILGLCDVVLASDKATFNVPVTPLGYVPAGCSSFTFPRILGTSKASDMLLFNRTINASEALEWGLVSRVFSDVSFLEESLKLLKDWSELPEESLRVNKTMLRDVTKPDLIKANRTETELGRKRWVSEESLAAVKRLLNQTKQNKQ